VESEKRIRNNINCQHYFGFNYNHLYELNQSPVFFEKKWIFNLDIILTSLNIKLEFIKFCFKNILAKTKEKNFSSILENTKHKMLYVLTLILRL
jgi:hypothetical protein